MEKVCLGCRGSILMQAGVQGAWGVIPVHLNELSAAAAARIDAGLAYQT